MTNKKPGVIVKIIVPADVAPNTVGCMIPKTIVFKKEGLEQIQAKGKTLDPYKHEVIDVIKGSKDDHILEELQKGYTLKGKVLRATKVRISKKDVEKIKSKEDNKNE